MPCPTCRIKAETPWRVSCFESQCLASVYCMNHTDMFSLTEWQVNNIFFKRFSKWPNFHFVDVFFFLLSNEQVWLWTTSCKTILNGKWGLDLTLVRSASSLLMASHRMTSFLAPRIWRLRTSSFMPLVGEQVFNSKIKSCFFAFLILLVWKSLWNPSNLISQLLEDCLACCIYWRC